MARQRVGKATSNVTKGRRRRGAVSVKITGDKEVIAGIKKYHKRAGGAYSRGMEKALIFLKKKSNEVAPIETGTLIAQSSVALTGRGFDRKGAVVYGPQGSISEKYAGIQHEMFEQKRKAGRQWKYLEEPFRRYRMEMLQIIADEIKKLR